MKLAKVQKEADIINEVAKHGHLIEDKQKQQKVTEIANEKIKLRQEEKARNRNKGKLIVEEEL